MVIYAVAIGSFLGAAVLLVVLLHRVLVAEDARYGARSVQEPAARPAPDAPRRLDRAA
jgi:hypothetical protein